MCLVEGLQLHTLIIYIPMKSVLSMILRTHRYQEEAVML